jgi:hypothetical protein
MVDDRRAQPAGSAVRWLRRRPRWWSGGRCGCCACGLGFGVPLLLMLAGPLGFRNAPIASTAAASMPCLGVAAVPTNSTAVATVA